MWQPFYLYLFKRTNNNDRTENSEENDFITGDIVKIQEWKMMIIRKIKSLELVCRKTSRNNFSKKFIRSEGWPPDI